jgi:hypothetical protein
MEKRSEFDPYELARLAVRRGPHAANEYIDEHQPPRVIGDSEDRSV